VFDPPPGHLDLLGDAETAEFSPRFDPLEVPGVGSLLARRPMPNAAATLAMTANPKLDNDARAEYAIRFVTDHLGDGELERVYVAMMTGDTPTDALERITIAVATWGTARPYGAVLTLVATTAHHWRFVRSKLLLSGVPDPMALRSMHVLLDATESLVMESLAAGGENGGLTRAQFIDRLYSPARNVKPGGAAPAPTGFEDDDTEAAFDAFVAAAR
jgi:hypothetical protein